jgi:hypothetical protein
MSTEFLDEMQSAQERLEEGPLLPRFLKTSDTQTTAADTATLTSLPPADFIRVYDDAALTWVDSDGATQEATRLDTYSQLVSKVNNGIPEGSIYYFIDEDGGTKSIRINQQSASFDFTLSYYASEPALTGANDNQWTTGPQASLIMAMAGIEIAVWLRDDRALQYFTALEQRERARMIRSIEADEWGGMSLVMGDPD